MKTCTKCGESKALSAFSVRKDTGGRRAICKPCEAARREEWKKSDSAAAREYRDRRSDSTFWKKHGALIRAKRRAAVLEAYGSKCVCCGEDTPEFLTVDHINNDGARHREAISPSDPRGGSGTYLYIWLKRHGFPKDNFQLLCWNCNCAKGRYGSCPHTWKIERRELDAPTTAKQLRASTRADDNQPSRED